VDVRLSPHPAQHLGSFLGVIQTIKQLEHFSLTPLCRGSSSRAY
jgi:hypothetical protein